MLLVYHVFATPAVDQQLSEVLGEPFVWYEEPMVIEPEKTVLSLFKHRY